MCVKGVCFPTICPLNQLYQRWIWVIHCVQVRKPRMDNQTRDCSSVVTEVWDKVMFLHLSVIVFTRGGLVSQHASQVTWPGGVWRTPPPALWDTVNKWVVCTLLECILVYGICNPISGLSLALIQKLVKISVGKWLLETTRPHKDVKTFGKYSSLFTHFKYFLAIVVSFESCILIDNLSEASLFHNCGQVDFPVDKLIPKVTRPLYECLKILNKWPVSSAESW